MKNSVKQVKDLLSSGKVTKKISLSLIGIVTSITGSGVAVVTFSSKVIIPGNYTNFDDKVLKLEIYNSKS